MEDIEIGIKSQEVGASTALFVPNLTKSDQVNKVLAEGMTEKDEFLYANGGGAEEMWKLIDLEAHQKESPQLSRVGVTKAREEKEEGRKLLADSWVPRGNSQQTNQGQHNQVVIFNTSKQQVEPSASQTVQPLLQQSSAIKKMSAQVYRQLFAKETTPFNVSFKNNNSDFQVQRVDKAQQLMTAGQSSAMVPTFKATEYRAEFAATKDMASQASRGRATRKEKGVAIVQSHGKPRKSIIARSIVQPDSFMASARGANRVGGPQEDVGPKKRSRTEMAKE